MAPPVRALGAGDAGAAGALLRELLGGTRHESRTLELLTNALEARDGDRGFVAVDEPEGAIRGVALVGAIAGATRVTKVHLIAGRDPLDHARLAERIVRDLTTDGARLAVAEVADEPVLSEMSSALNGVGFAEEGRVADWFADGVAMRVLVARAPFVTPAARAT
jgi:hypothetical protein